MLNKKLKPKRRLAYAILLLTIAGAPLCLADHGPQTLFQVTSDTRSTTTPVQAMVDDNGDLTGLIVGNDSYLAARLHSDTLIHIDGVDDSKKVLYLNASKVDPKIGGAFTMRYLQNGVSDHYQTLTLELKRDDSGWEVLANNRQIKLLQMKSNKMFMVGTIGIEEIEPIYASRDSRPGFESSFLANAGDAPEKQSDTFDNKFVPSFNPGLQGTEIPASTAACDLRTLGT